MGGQQGFFFFNCTETRLYCNHISYSCCLTVNLETVCVVILSYIFLRALQRTLSLQPYGNIFLSLVLLCLALLESLITSLCLRQVYQDHSEGSLTALSFPGTPNILSCASCPPHLPNSESAIPKLAGLDKMF